MNNSDLSRSFFRTSFGVMLVEPNQGAQQRLIFEFYIDDMNIDWRRVPPLEGSSQGAL